VALPFTPVARAFGFTAVPLRFVASMSAIVAVYIASAEMVKRWFFHDCEDMNGPLRLRR
jgi:Mg2+-importing ATPase